MTVLPLKNDCFVTSLTLTALRRFGPESQEWDPLILRDSFEKAFDIPKMKQKMFDKLNCGYTLVGTDAFTSTIEGFLTSTAIMNNMVFDHSEIPYCTLKQCAWSVWEYMNLTGNMENSKPTEPFSSDIILYLQEVGRANGISKLPTWLSFAAAQDDAMPDLTGDVSLFELYQERQQNYISDLNSFVTQRQDALKDELLTLQKAGFVG